MSTLRQAAQQALEALEERYVGALRDKAIDALEVALAEPEQPVAIKWTLNGDKHCGYSNWLGETPFGRILITWKSWKDLSDACVDEFPGGFWAYGEPDEVKAQCEAEFCRRLGTAPTPRKPLTMEQLHGIREHQRLLEELGPMWAPMLYYFCQSIERAHGITGENT